MHLRQLATNGSSWQVLVNCIIVFAMFLILYFSADSNDVDLILGLSTAGAWIPALSNIEGDLFLA